MPSIGNTEGAFVWSVEAWGSDPVHNNDDHWQAKDFGTEEEARAFMSDPDFGADTSDTAFLRLVTGTVTFSHNVVDTRRGAEPGGVRAVMTLEEVTVIETVVCPGYDAEARQEASEAFDREWAQERAMQAGMMGGCDAYNDAIGSPLGDPEDSCRCRGGGCAYCEPHIFI